MDPLDAFLWLQLTRYLAPSAAEAIVQAWSSAGTPGERLAEYLARIGTFSPSAPRMVGLLHQGVLADECFWQLFSPAALAKMRPAEQVSEVTPVVDSPPLPEVGQVVGDYLLTRLLSEGGSSLIYRAIHHERYESVALKFVHPTLLIQEPGLRRVLHREAALLANCRHPNLVGVHGFVEADGFAFMVMEMVEGVDLHELTHSSGRVQPERALAFVAQAAAGLRAVWDVGLVHRDVKPANLLLARSGVVKVADLGLVYVPTGDGRMASARVGTVGYAAPEQIRGAALDFRADLYGLGATLYHLLTGGPPYRADTLEAQVAMQVAGPPARVADVPATISDLVTRLLAYPPDERFGTVEAFITALDAV